MVINMHMGRSSISQAYFLKVKKTKCLTLPFAYLRFYDILYILFDRKKQLPMSDNLSRPRVPLPTNYLCNT